MRESGQNVRAGNRPKWVTELIGVLADILIAAVILLVFAYIHHGRAYLFGKLEADIVLRRAGLERGGCACTR